MVSFILSFLFLWAVESSLTCDIWFRDSRTIHWNSAPTGEQTRFITYVCYCPRSWMTDEELQKKREVFEARKGTTHWPVLMMIYCMYPLGLSLTSFYHRT